MKDFKISAEVARDQLDLFLEYYEIDSDDIPEKQIEAVEASKNRVIKAIRKGKLEVTDNDGCVKFVQHLKTEKTIIYGEISGQSKIAMKSKLEADYYGRIYALVGSLTGVGETGILKLKGADMSLAECIGALFLQV